MRAKMSILKRGWHFRRDKEHCLYLVKRDGCFGNDRYMNGERVRDGMRYFKVEEKGKLYVYVCAPLYVY